MLFDSREHGQSMDNNFIVLYHQEAGAKRKVSIVTSATTVGGSHSATPLIVCFTIDKEELKEHFSGCNWPTCAKDFHKASDKGSQPSITTFVGTDPPIYDPCSTTKHH
jgi:hypothetical protein